MNILYVSGTRADYGLMSRTLRTLSDASGVRLSIVATGSHLRKDRGYTLREIRADGFTVTAKIPPWNPRRSSRATMAVQMGHMLAAMAEVFESARPDVVLLLGDRDEQLAAAIAAYHLGLFIAHIHGGDVSGGIDDPHRHSITRYAHLHFAACKDSADRLVRMGEQPFRVKNVGTPALVGLASHAPKPLERLLREWNVPIGEAPYFVLSQHPVTTQPEASTRQIQATLDALTVFKHKVVAILPNTDSGHEGMTRILERADRQKKVFLLRHVPRDDFLSLLFHSEGLVGNSSGALIEGSYLCVPAVDIGLRQQGRFRGVNVVHAEHSKESVVRAIRRILQPGFRSKLFATRHIYGRGDADARMLRHLKSIDTRSEKWKNKALTY